MTLVVGLKLRYLRSIDGRGRQICINGFDLRIVRDAEFG